MWEILGTQPGQRIQDQNGRVISAMRMLGWTRPANRQIRVGSKNVVGFVKGKKPWKQVYVHRDRMSGEMLVDYMLPHMDEDEDE